MFSLVATSTANEIQIGALTTPIKFSCVNMITLQFFLFLIYNFINSNIIYKVKELKGFVHQASDRRVRLLFYTHGYHCETFPVMSRLGFWLGFEKNNHSLG